MANILIIDDNRDTCHALGLILERAGHTARFVADAPAGLAVLRMCRLDLLILDLMMPGMDGLEVLREVRRDPDHHDLPVIMFTASAEPAHEAAARRLGVTAFVAKGRGGWENLSTLIDLASKQRPHRVDDGFGGRLGRN